MIIRNSFDDFLGKISLDKTRREKIMTAHNNVRDLLANDEEVGPVYFETFLQGSYRLGTAVRPQGDGSYDVDVVLVLNLKDFAGPNSGMPSAHSVIAWLVRRLTSYPVYATKVKAGRRCVRIDYADGFHMDIIPAHCDGDTDAPLLVPANWGRSHPKRFRSHCVRIHATSNEKFYAVVKMLKWWRNIHFGDESSPRSILLTTIVSDHISKAASVDEALVETMESLRSFFSKNFSVPEVCNPSLPEEKLSASWSWLDYHEFKTKFASATTAARQAFDAKDEESTIKRWNANELFKETFPKALYGLEEEAGALANAMRSGSLFTSSIGVVSSVASPGKIPVPYTRYFGH
jgi:hypothetical protein